MSAARLLAKAARPAARQCRRLASGSALPGGKAKGDLPWVIGSAAVFGPALFYLLTPPDAHAKHEHHGDYRMKASGLSKMYKEEAAEEAASEDSEDDHEASGGSDSSDEKPSAFDSKRAIQAGLVKSGDGKSAGRDENGTQVAKSKASSTPEKSKMDMARAHVASNSNDSDEDGKPKETNPKALVAAHKTHSEESTKDTTKSEPDADDE